MNVITRKLKRIFDPRISRELQREIDKQNVRNMILISTIAMCVELAVLLAYLMSSLRSMGEETLKTMLRVGFCVLICGVNLLVILQLRRKEDYRHRIVSSIMAADYVFLVGWALFTSYSHYAQGHQILTFYAVLLCFQCFVSFRPPVSCALTLLAYSALAVMAVRVDGFQGLNIFNYVVMLILTVAAMIARYDQQIKISRTFLELQSRNRDLSHTSRHDALTGLRNREALSQDQELFYGMPLTVIMTDIDFFKKVNDVHGHAVGDRALQEAARLLREAYPGSMVYRYGGDEFLVIHRNLEQQPPWEPQKVLSFSVPIRSDDLKLSMSAGFTVDTPADEAELKALIEKADAQLYVQKHSLHGGDASPEQRP